MPALFTLLLLVAASASPSAQPASDALSLAAFRAELDRLSAELSRADDPAAATAIRATIPETWTIVEGSDRFDVSARWLKAALGQAAARPADWSDTRSRVSRRLTEIREHAATLAEVPGTDARAAARRTADAILSREEFQQSAASRWREQIQERVGRWIEELWSRLGGPASAGRRTAVVFAWAAALAALAGLAFWLARSIAERPRGAALDLAQGVPRPRARDLALRALAEARAGNVREAVRSGYHAAIVRLEEDGAWRVDESRTPREYLPMLRASDARRPPLVDLTMRFEQIWYGNRAVTAEDTPRVAAHLETLGCLRPGERAI